MTTSDFASWVQAVGTILAIVASVWVVNWQHRVELRATKHRLTEDAKSRLSKLQVLVDHSWSVVNSLVDDPDDPGALARKWREKANNDVGLQLAQVEFSLNQLQSIPLLDVPIGANMVMTVYELAYALMVAKSALTQQLSAPFTEEVPVRVSNLVFGAKVSAGRAVVRTAAVQTAIRRQ